MKYYKALTKDNRGTYSDYDFTDYLPKNGKPGKWLPKVETLDMCASGYHYAKQSDIIDWLNEQIFEVEVKGKTIKGDNKSAAQQIRFVRKCAKWNDKSARLFACDCAERVLPLYEKEYPDDKRPRMAIETARKFANGKATQEELAAAWAAAWAAAREAAWEAAGEAAREAERKWQNKRIAELLK
jgi:hypothetical protein